MNEIEIAAGATLAAQHAAFISYRRTQDDVLHLVHGSRHRTCAVANELKLKEANELLERAGRLLTECAQRRARMLDE